MFFLWTSLFSLSFLFSQIREATLETLTCTWRSMNISIELFVTKNTIDRGVSRKGVDMLKGRLKVREREGQGKTTAATTTSSSSSSSSSTASLRDPPRRNTSQSKNTSHATTTTTTTTNHRNKKNSVDNLEHMQQVLRKREEEQHAIVDSLPSIDFSGNFEPPITSNFGQRLTWCKFIVSFFLLFRS